MMLRFVPLDLIESKSGKFLEKMQESSWKFKKIWWRDYEAESIRQIESSKEEKNLVKLVSL